MNALVTRQQCGQLYLCVFGAVPLLWRCSWWDNSALKWLVSPHHTDCVQLSTSDRGKRNELGLAGVFSDPA